MPVLSRKKERKSVRSPVPLSQHKSPFCNQLAWSGVEEAASFDRGLSYYLFVGGKGSLV